MHINCQKEDLLYGVQAVVRAVSNKNTLPILGGIMLLAEDNKLILKATDLEIAIECIINVDVVEEGTVVVPGRYFSDLVRHLPSCDISLVSENNRQMNVIYEQSQISVYCFDAEEFPALPQVDGEISGSIPNPVFRRLVRQVSIAASTDEVRPIFTGILLELKAGKIAMIATDTHRLAIGEGIWQGQGQESLILPARTMQEISRLMTNMEEPITITATKNQVYFCSGNITFTSRVISGQYPDYKQVLPSESFYVSKSVINRQKLLDSLERASLLSRDVSKGKGNIVKLSWQDDSLVISADVPDVGNIKEEIFTMLEGSQLVASYNARYLIEVLKVLESEKIVMRMTGSVTPGIIMPDEMDEEESYLYLVLPIRVNN